MRILIEEYQYNVSEVHDALYGIDAMENIEGKVSIHYVGYYYNALLDDCVLFFLKSCCVMWMVRNLHLANTCLMKLSILKVRRT